MALTVEDGSGLVDADALITVSEARTFASNRGVTLSATDSVVEQQIRLAHDYLAAVENRLQGNRAVAGQALPFPRKCVYLFGAKVADDEIPTQVKNAICQLVVESQNQDVLPSGDGRQVTQEVVGPISTTYAPGSGTQPTLPRVDAFLAPLFTSGGGMALTSLRV